MVFLNLRAITWLFLKSLFWVCQNYEITSFLDNLDLSATVNIQEMTALWPRRAVDKYFDIAQNIHARNYLVLALASQEQLFEIVLVPWVFEI